MIDTLSRYKGSLLGLAVGDALGTTLEFQPRNIHSLLTEIVGGGTFNLLPGQWTDDTSMALCLAESLVLMQGMSPVDQMNRYLKWYQEGYLSSTGRCFDIGNTTRTALERFAITGSPLCGTASNQGSGNGAIMRLAPVAMAHRNAHALDDALVFSTRTTHGSLACTKASQFFGLLLEKAYNGEDKKWLLRKYNSSFNTPHDLSLVIEGSYLHKSSQSIKGSGYVVESLEAALWAVFNANSFEEAVILAANLGDDADTTAAVAGQLAGAIYGYEAIPDRWREIIYMKEYILELAEKLYILNQKILDVEKTWDRSL